jgi:hypothetical protein
MRSGRSLMAGRRSRRSDGEDHGRRDEEEYYAAFTRIDEGPAKVRLTVLIFGTGERERKLAKEIAKLLDGRAAAEQLAEVLRCCGKNDMAAPSCISMRRPGKAVVSHQGGRGVGRC